MSSSDFNKVLVLDDRIANLTDTLDYAVVKGGANITSASYTAQSATNSSHTYSVQVPSEQTVIGREVMWSSTVQFKITGTALQNEYLVDYGNTEAFAPFPMNQMVETLSSTINNNTVSMNVKDMIAPLLRLHDQRELNRYNGLTPTMVDTYKHYDDANAKKNNPLGNYGDATDNDNLPRGAFKIESVSGNTVGDGNTVKTVLLTVKFTEPLLSSPWLFANPSENNQGIYGIQNLSFQMNLDQSCKRVWRTSRSVANLNVSVNAWSDSKLIFTYLTPSPSSLLPSRNVCPYYNMERFIYNQYNTVAFGHTATLQSPTLQLNSIPDKIYIVARKRMTTQSYNDTDSFMAIEGISINFNNSSGLGSSFTQQDLYKITAKNNLNLSWQEFTGYANGAMSGGNITQVPTTGSVLCLGFGTDIQLNEDYLAQGSLGSYQLSIKVDVRNQNIDAGTGDVNNYIPELMIITQTSGVMVLEKGTCSTYLGLLTKSDVLDASTQQPTSISSVKRLVGGGFFDSLKSVIKPLAKIVAPLAKEKLGSMGTKGQLGKSAIEALGYGKGSLQNRLH